jgi:hypothetical protein
MIKFMSEPAGPRPRPTVGLGLGLGLPAASGGSRVLEVRLGLVIGPAAPILRHSIAGALPIIVI